MSALEVNLSVPPLLYKPGVLVEAGEPVGREALVPEPGVERFNEAVLLGFAGLKKEG